MHIYQQLNLKNKTNKQTEKKQNHRYRECFDGCQMGGGQEDGQKKVKGLRSIIR